VLVAVIGARQYGKWRDGSSGEAFSDFIDARNSNSAEALEQVVADNKAAPVTALSRLILGNRFYTEGRYDVAKGVYNDFLKNHPRHPHANIAKLGLAFCAEGLGDVDDAAAQFKAFAEANKGNYLEPQARIGHGRSLILAGKKDEGQIVLDLFITEFAGTKWAAYADEVLRNRNRLVIPKPVDKSADETFDIRSFFGGEVVEIGEVEEIEEVGEIEETGEIEEAGEIGEIEEAGEIGEIEEAEAVEAVEE
jgi:tetratricopeptide (TPR) repeat protein